MDVTKEYRMQSSKEYRANIENVSVHILVDYANDFELPFKYWNGFSYKHYRVIAVEKGAVDVHFSDSLLVLKENDVVVIPPGRRHLVLRENDATMYFMLGFKIDDNSLKECHNYYKKLKRVFGDDYTFLENSPEILGGVKKCFQMLTLGMVNSVGVAVHELLRAFIEGSASGQDNLPEDYKSNMSRVHKINMLVHSYYDKDVSVGDIAQLLFLSHSQTNRIIKQNFGVTWKELVIKRRMEVALWNIANRDMTLAELAEFVGYDSERGFYTAFKKYFGKTPSFFRGKRDLAETMLQAERSEYFDILSRQG